MKIQYIKNAPLGAMGDIAEVPDDQARVLITLGIAKPYDETPKPKSKSKKSADLLDVD